MTVRMKVITPTENLTLTDRKAFVDAAIRLGIERALKRGLAGSENELVIRHLRCLADLGTALEAWLTAPLLVVNTPYSVFQAIGAVGVGVAVPNNNVFVFYKVGVNTPGVPMVVSLLNFAQGAAGGTTYALFDLQQLASQLIPEGYFSEPIVYEPNEVMLITATCAVVTNLPAEVPLGCLVIEPKGPVISG